MSTKADWKTAKKYIKKRNLDLYHYPKIKQYAELSFFLFYYSTFTWEQCEERFSHKSSLLVKLVEALYSNAQIDQAFSLIKRHKLLNHENYNDKEVLQKYEENLENFQYISNKLFDHDKFAPYEVAYNNCDEKEFVLLKDYGISENDIYIVDQENNLFIEAFDCLFASKIVNFYIYPKFFNLIRLVWIPNI